MSNGRELFSSLVPIPPFPLTKWPQIVWSGIFGPIPWLSPSLIILPNQIAACSRVYQKLHVNLVVNREWVSRCIMDIPRLESNSVLEEISYEYLTAALQKLHYIFWPLMTSGIRAWFGGRHAWPKALLCSVRGQWRSARCFDHLCKHCHCLRRAFPLTSKQFLFVPVFRFTNTPIPNRLDNPLSTKVQWSVCLEQQEWRLHLFKTMHSIRLHSTAYYLLACTCERQHHDSMSSTLTVQVYHVALAKIMHLTMCCVANAYLILCLPSSDSMSNLNGDLDDADVIGVAVGVGIPLLVLICVVLVCVPLVCVCCCRRRNKNHMPEATPEREF